MLCCGECLMAHKTIVKLRKDGTCRCCDKKHKGVTKKRNHNENHQ